MALDNLSPNDIFFQNILHKGMRDKTIQDVVLLEKKAALNKGENYLSYLTRFTLKYVCNVPKGLAFERVDRKAHLIMKEAPGANDLAGEYIRRNKVFDNERHMLEDVLPQIEELVGKKLGPKVYYSLNKPNVIIMEDLMPLGFRNRNRKVGFNEAEVFMTLENLADFHAGSILLEEQNPGSLSRISNAFVSRNLPEGFFRFISTSLASIGAGIRDWQNGKFVSISDKLQKVSEEITQKLFVVFEYDEDELLVLNHGDMWMNNIMFKDNENGGVQECRFVDYQMSIWTSPAGDLAYFLSLVPEISLKFTHDDIFLQKFLDRLSSTMKKLGCVATPPTLEQLKKSMHKRRHLALMAALTFYPKMIAEDDEIEPMDEVMKNGVAKVNLLKNPKVREIFVKILPILDERGYLD
ncbi:uncharacterized protein LOC107037209 [Diachasma alloeum]|uniref:uncharacterized protein LOC107037209 n=1 Tax=Diachasma alloeum TaxID=454923 RepID=UPI0007382F32|nr:uncharacterized protein LOC107037209 [Diachasma alloeum]